jgi:GNAT superfamily N-acetyltransferase
MMQKIETYDQLAPLLRQQLRPGLVTNVVLSQEEFCGEIAAGSLYVWEFPGGLLLLRQRRTHQCLSFYLQKGAELPNLTFQRPTVLEIAFRDRDKALQEVGKRWEAQGFTLEFSRQRMTRKAGLELLPGPLSAHLATLEELPELQTLLETCFDPMTGCIPTRDQLKEAIQAGECFYFAGGLLHMTRRPYGTELRHLAVAASRRRQGAAQSLFYAYQSGTGNGTSRVWVRKDNSPALKFYSKNGYEADGWTSRVYTFRKDD